MKRGFTLIELIIVMAIVGLLATALVIVINPLELSNKAHDVSAKAALKTIYDTTMRFNTNKGYMPWCTDPATCANLITPAPINADPIPTVVANFISANEAGTDFRTNLSGTLTGDITMQSPAANDKVVICFQPKSKAYKADKSNIYKDVYGVIGDATECPQTAASTCYTCLIGI